MFDAINAIRGGYRGFTDQPRAPEGASVSAAIAQAAHDTLAALYPSQRAAFDDLLARDMASLRDIGKAACAEVGKRAAAAILALAATRPRASPRVGGWRTTCFATRCSRCAPRHAEPSLHVIGRARVQPVGRARPPHRTVPRPA